jgi:hypothetical protein
VARHALRDFEFAAGGQIVGDAGGTEGMAPYRGIQLSVGGPPLDHRAERCSKEPPLLVLTYAGSSQVCVEVGLKLVVAGRLCDFAILLVSANLKFFS